MLEYIQYISILLELGVAILGLLIAINKKKLYGLGIFLTFIIYVFYDYTKATNKIISEATLSILFLIATISMLGVVWHIYDKHHNNPLISKSGKTMIKSQARDTKRYSHRALNKTLFGYRKR